MNERLKQLRKEKGLSQKELAFKLGMSQGYLSDIEKGNKTPGGDILVSIKRFFNIDLNWLLLGEENTTRESTPPIYQTEEKRVLEYGRRKTDLPMSKQLRRAVEGLLYLEQVDQDGFTLICGKIIEREEKAKEMDEVKKIGNAGA